MRTIFRDSFARFDFLSTVIHHTGQITCKWCGSKGRELKKRFALKKYGVNRDSISNTTDWDRELFCCKSCRDSYYS